MRASKREFKARETTGIGPKNKLSLRLIPRTLTLALLALLTFAPNISKAADSETERFLKDYAQAWSSRSPVALLRLAQSPTVFAELVGLERWDHVAQSKALISLVSEETDLRNQRILVIRRQQHDRFAMGTYATADVVEKLVVRTMQGRIKIIRYDGVGQDRSQSADPNTWGTDRESERILMLAAQDLSAREQDRCLNRLSALFDENSEKDFILPIQEPFDDRQTAAANGFFLRAACQQLGQGNPSKVENNEPGPSAVSRIRADLDAAIQREPDHGLARTLRARMILRELPRLSGEALNNALGIALEDAQHIERLAPDNEEASALSHLLGTIHTLRAPGPSPDALARRRVAQELIRSPGRVATEVLRRLGSSKDLYRAGPEALTIAAEFALVDGHLQEAAQLLGLLGIRCGSCAGYFYLRGREAELQKKPSEALNYYAAVLERAPAYRDAVWRYASLGLADQREDRNPILGRLNAALRRLSGFEASYLRVLTIFSQGSKRNEGLVALLAERAPDAPLPASVRLALAQTLSKR